MSAGNVKHTPGPWEVQRYTNYVGHSIFASGKGCIAERWYPAELTEDENREMKETANLIAAAPELLEALKALMAWSDHSSLTGLPEGDPVASSAPSFDETVKMVHAAIAKAEAVSK